MASPATNGGFYILYSLDRAGVVNVLSNSLASAGYRARTRLLKDNCTWTCAGYYTISNASRRIAVTWRSGSDGCLEL